MFCRAPGLPQNESEVELTLDDIQEGASSELDLEEAYQQLERMKQRVLQMKSTIVRTLPAEQLGTEQVPSSDSDNVNLREIQLETSRGFQQIEAVKSRLKETSDELSDVGARIEETLHCTEKLAKQLDEVPKWMEEHKEQAGECLERYHELDTRCCTDFDYGSTMRPHLMTLTNAFRAKIPLKCYKIEYRGLAKRLARTRCMLNRTREVLMHSIRKIEEALRSPGAAPEMPFLMVLPEMLEADEKLDELNDNADTTESPGEIGIQGSRATTAHRIRTQ